MKNRWTQKELNHYADAIKKASKQKAAKEYRRKQKLNRLFEKLHGKTKKEAK